LETGNETLWLGRQHRRFSADANVSACDDVW
jgi:hypothetical protein